MSFIERINIFQRISRWVDRLYEGESIKISPQPIFGPWVEGYSLDNHSLPLEVQRDPNLQVIMKRDQGYSPIGAHLRKYKYWNEDWHLEAISLSASSFLKEKNRTWKLDSIIPVLPSRKDNKKNHVREISFGIGRKCNIAVDINSIIKTKDTPELKSIFDQNERAKLLEGVFDVNPDKLEGKNILLLDDVYRSGATLWEICNTINNRVKKINIFVLTITKAKANR